MSQPQEGRKLKFHIFKYDPQDPNDKPRMETFEVTEAPGMTIFIALNEIRQKQDRALRFVGIGGPLMAARGVDLLAGLDELAVMGFAEVIPRLPFFRRLAHAEAPHRVARKIPRQQTLGRAFAKFPNRAALNNSEQGLIFAFVRLPATAVMQLHYSMLHRFAPWPQSQELSNPRVRRRI